MSGKEFFVGRYEQLGWKYKPVKLRQAIRFNYSNIGSQDLVSRLCGLGLN
jgi:hypothetical protein